MSIQLLVFHPGNILIPANILISDQYFDACLYFGILLEILNICFGIWLTYNVVNNKNLLLHLNVVYAKMLSFIQMTTLVLLIWIHYELIINC